MTDIRDRISMTEKWYKHKDGKFTVERFYENMDGRSIFDSREEVSENQVPFVVLEKFKDWS